MYESYGEPLVIPPPRRRHGRMACVRRDTAQDLPVGSCDRFSDEVSNWSGISGTCHGGSLQIQQLLASLRVRASVPILGPRAPTIL